MKKKTKPPRLGQAHPDVVATQTQLQSPSPIWIAAVGLTAFTICIILGLFLIPLSPDALDTTHFKHWVKTNFNYASSPIDLSVLSPFQGLAGLCLPSAVWIHPAYLLMHLIPFGEPRVWGFLVVMPLMTFATFLLGRANGLSWPLAIIGAQLFTLFSFPPFFEWSQTFTHYNGSILFTSLEGITLPAIMGTTFLAVFSYLGNCSRKTNIVCVVLLPPLLVYSILCDPLYTAVLFIPIAPFLGGVLLGSRNRSVLLWRLLAGAVCLLVCLGLNLHGFYHALTGYCARATFPNELYVEVQQWDRLTALFFQGGLAPFAVGLMTISALITIAYGSSQMRGFCLSVICFQWLMVAVCVFYVYSGARWSQPLPVYLEVGAQPAYMVAGLLGLQVLAQRFFPRAPNAARSGQKHQAGRSWLRRGWAAYASVLAIPLVASLWIWQRSPGVRPLTRHTDQPAPAVGLMKLLEENAALGTNGQFRGSVAMVVAVPGGGFLNRFGIPESEPFNKLHIYVMGNYCPSFAPDLYMTGLWNHRIPTLEDNNHLVTPPFHFLISRALSRPQDFHSRNWALITQANPKLMAALGARYLITDKPLSDALLTPVTQVSNADGVVLYLYEIQHANVANLCPTQTIVSTNAQETLSLMTSNTINLQDTAIIYDSPLTGLTRAESTALFYEKGGFRVRAKSHGPCLLVLPVQFSHSLQITARADSPDNQSVQLRRVNLLQTGILFNGDINVKIAHVFGPLRGVRGRLQDIEDCRRLGIKETGEIPYPPDYQPLGRKELATSKP